MKTQVSEEITTMTTIRIGKLSYDPQNIISKGFNDTIVFSGFHTNNFIEAIFWFPKPVAIKRIKNSNLHFESIIIQKEILQKASNHPNILRYICTERNQDFT